MILQTYLNLSGVSVCDNNGCAARNEGRRNKETAYDTYQASYGCPLQPPLQSGISPFPLSVPFLPLPAFPAGIRNMYILPTFNHFEIMLTFPISLLTVVFALSCPITLIFCSHLYLSKLRNSK